MAFFTSAAPLEKQDTSGEKKQTYYTIRINEKKKKKIRIADPFFTFFLFKERSWTLFERSSRSDYN